MPLSSEQARRIALMGGGRPKGSLALATKLRMKSQAVINNMIMKKSQQLIHAGMTVALGQNFVYRIDEEKNDKGNVTSRKHVLVEDPEEIALALDQMGVGATHPDDKYYYVTAKEPDHKAIEMLLNRAYGKPKESLDLNVDVKFSLKALAESRKELKSDTTLNIPSEVIEHVREDIEEE
jgi:hypothetical protein